MSDAGLAHTAPPAEPSPEPGPEPGPETGPKSNAEPNAEPASCETQHLVAQGLVAHKSGDLSEAETKYRAALAIKPTDCEALMLLGMIACQMGDHGAATTLTAHAIANHPEHPNVPARYNINLANALHGAARLDDAVVALHRALTTDPHSMEGHFNLANVLGDLQRPEEAEVEYRFAIELQPAYAKAHAGLARVLEQQGRRREAIKALETALSCDADLAEAAQTLGCLLCEEERYDEALPLLENALGAKAQGALGTCHAARRDWIAARDVFAEILRAEPRSSTAHAGLGQALYRLGSSEMALSHLLRANELDATMAEPLVLAGMIGMEQGDIPIAISRLEKAVEMAPRDHRAHCALVRAKSLLRAAPDGDVLADGAHWEECHGSTTPIATPRPSRLDPNRRLKIGFVTGGHPGDTALQALLCVLGYRQPGSIETYCYADLEEREQLGAVLGNLADHWADTRSLSDSALCTRIHNDEIDILIDLAGTQPDNRLRALARRPAPLQIAWLGQRDPLGFGFFDHYMTDGQKGGAAHSERALPMEAGLIAFVPPEEVPKPGPLPMMSGQAAHFLSMGNLWQISEESIALFSRALTSIDDSRLRLVVLQSLHRDTERRLRRRFADYGVAESRVELVSLAERAEQEDISLEAIFDCIDIALDPYPASNGFESFLALLSGVPVVSLAGPLAASHLTESLLQRLGLANLAATSIVDFVGALETLVANPAKLANLRASLPASVVQSPVTDGPAMVEGFDKALRQAWGHYCVLHHPAASTQH